MILEKLRKFKLQSSVVVLNDFFLDRIMQINDIEKIYSQILVKSEYGGSIRDIPQRDLKGGNATNVAYALARLGSPVTLITVGDKASSNLLKEAFLEFKKSSLFVIDGKPGRTTSLEFSNNENIVNIMLSDLGDNENFGPEKLGSKEQQAIKRSDAVIVTNWASNKKGTELCKFVFDKSPKALHFLDPADISTRAREFQSALGGLGSYLDSLSLNENEFDILLQQYGLGPLSGVEDNMKLVLELSKKIHVSIDLHATSGSFWSDGNQVEFVKSFPVNPLLVTGAGDVWDAGNIIGYLANLEPAQRLLFANAASSLYISNKQAIPPTLADVLRFINK